MAAEPTPFEELSSRAQLYRLRQAAITALADYPIEPRRLRIINHDYNATFRVDTVDGRRFALRLNTNPNKGVPQLESEMAWLHALAVDTSIRVPAPLAANDGRLYTSVRVESLGRELPVAVMSWLPGRDLGEPEPAAIRELGRITAVLHDHAEAWTMPPHAGLPSHRHILVDEPNRFDDYPLDAHQRTVIEDSLRVAQDINERAFDRDSPRPLHADLHLWNVKWLHGRMAVFDFDDALMGVPVQDLGITCFYFRDDDAAREALIEGYASVRPVPGDLDESIDGLLAGRNLLLLNDVIGSQTADIRALIPVYLPNSVTKLAAFLETGRFRHLVPGLLPTS